MRILATADVLRVVRENEGCTSGDVARLLGVTIETASSRLSALTKTGAVTRKQDPATTKLKYVYFPAASAVAAKEPLQPRAKAMALPPPRAELSKPAPAPQEGAAEPAAPSTGIEALLTGLADALADALVNRVLSQVEARLADTVSARVGAAVETAVTEAAERSVGQAIAGVTRRIQETARGEERTKPGFVRAGRLRVTVVGLRGDQETEVWREFGKELDLRFYSKDRNVKDLWASTKSSDHLVVMTGWVSHAHTAVAARHPGYIPLEGHLMALKDKLTDLYLKKEAENGN